MSSRFARLSALLLALALVAAACGGDDDDQGQGGDGEDRKGGSIVVVAEQWPECINTITSCANSSWTGWSVTNYVLPQAMEFDEKGNFVASPLLVEAPTIENGGIQEDPFRITFKIREEAVWDDGTPITSKDFEFTWKARLETKGTLTKVGYDKITAVDTSDPKTAIIEFSETYADWGDLFGGNQHYVIKADAFESTDVSGDMLDEITFSGGPFKLQSWNDQQAVLVRNEAYWDEDRKPLLDQVTMVPRTDQDTEIAALKSGEGVAIFPQPAPGFQQKIEADNIEFNVGAGVVFEGLWFNLQADAPTSERAVREALFYGVDREAIVNDVMGQIVEGVEVLNCAGWVPTVGEWCDNSDFADFTYQPEKSKEILEADGWTEGSDGIFTKGGERLSVEWNTVAGNKRREDTQVLVKEQLKAAGIEVIIKNFDAGELFDNKLPKLDFAMAEYAQVASPDPSVTTIYACENIPSEENDFSGQNASAWCNEEATRIMHQSDSEVDPAKRLELIHQIGDKVREDLVWLPLYQLPSITAWRTDKIAGPIGTYTSSPPGGFWNMYDWYLVK